MLADFFSLSLRPAGVAPRSIRGLDGVVEAQSASWTSEEMAVLVERLREGGSRLRAVPIARRLEVWSATVEAFLDPAGPKRRALARDLVILTRLSERGLAAALETVLGGVRAQPMSRLFADAAAELRGDSVLAAVFLAGNLPALAVQPLVAAVVLGIPMLVKTSSAEPLFAPAFLAALAAREPAFGAAFAAATWSGGDHDLEMPLLARADRVLAYGEADTLADLEARAPGRVVGYGPKASLAIVGRAADPRPTARGIARDIGLFDQRGCLSIHAVYVEGGDPEAIAFAATLADELAALARELPPGSASLAEKSAVRQLRECQELAGGLVMGGALGAGTILVVAEPAFVPSPGLRTVRIHPLADLALLPRVLAPWKGRLQGVAIDGVASALAPTLQSALGALGVSRFATSGNLQQPDVTWHNGGVPPLRALGARTRTL